MRQQREVGVPMRLFVKDVKGESGSRFMNVYTDLNEAVSETKSFYEREGLPREQIESKNLPRSVKGNVSG